MAQRFRGFFPVVVDVETGAVLSAHNSIFKKDYLAKVLFETVQQNAKNN